jgi:citrate lyase subunit beta/citryl-CoA lyase
MWRSILFMPVLEERFLAKAAERGADAIALDLEASISADRKEEARRAVPAAIERLHGQGLDVLVRINQLWWPALEDLQYVVCGGLKAVVLPTCSSASQIDAVDGCLGELEEKKGLPVGGIGIVPLIETARGVRDIDGILRASKRIVAMGFGAEDYIADMQATLSTELLTITSVALTEAARAAGVVPFVIPESLANLSDLDAFEAAARRGLQMGSEGSFCVHPGQVAKLNQVFTPSDEELAQAARIVAAAQQAAEQGLGAVRLDVVESWRGGEVR